LNSSSNCIAAASNHAITATLPPVAPQPCHCMCCSALPPVVSCCIGLLLACHGCIGTVCRTVACCCPVCCGHIAAAHCAVLGCCLACCGCGAAAHHVVTRCCLARRVSWHGVWPWHLMARRAVPGVLRVVVWCTATVCRGMVHSRGVSCLAYVTVTSLRRVVLWRVAAWCVMCCGTVHGHLLSGRGTVRRGVYPLDMRTTAALLPAQPGKRKKKRKKRKRQLTMARGRLVSHLVSCHGMVRRGSAQCTPHSHTAACTTQ